MAADLAAFESTVLDQAPPGAVVIGASLSPDSRYGAALTLLPSANYLMDDVLVRDGDRWQLHTGGSGGGISWAVRRKGDRGVLRYGGQAPEDASNAWVSYKGVEYRVPVRYGHFFFVAWDAASDEIQLSFASGRNNARSTSGPRFRQSSRRRSSNCYPR
jgi:hypothetical protein